MSRTIRCKDFEQSRRSNKTIEQNFYSDVTVHYDYYEGHGGYWIYTPMSEKDRKKTWWVLHSESKSNLGRGPNKKHYRKPAKRKLKSYNDREMIRALSDFDYDAQFLGRVDYCRSDWRYW